MSQVSLKMSWVVLMQTTLHLLSDHSKSTSQLSTIQMADRQIVLNSDRYRARWAKCFNPLRTKAVYSRWRVGAYCVPALYIYGFELEKLPWPYLDIGFS